ncbi:hypothetical protein BHE74_00029775 [Ensete ventricosum]|nr:hypothetical protein BHE74_00029775 [Ensete ventricosum]
MPITHNWLLRMPRRLGKRRGTTSLSGSGGPWLPTRNLRGFCCGLEHANQVMYEFGYQIALRCFKVRYPELEVDENPFKKLLLDEEVPAPTKVPFDNHPTTPLGEVLAPTKVPFNNHPTTPLALPPPS